MTYFYAEWDVYKLVYMFGCGSVAVLFQPSELVEGRPQLPDYSTAMKRLAERRGQLTASRFGDVIGRRAQSCDSLATPPQHRRISAHPDDSEPSEDGIKF